MLSPLWTLGLIAFLLSSVWTSLAQECLYKVKESIAPPRGWVQHSLAPHDHTIQLRVGLPQHNFHILEQHLYEVSDPFHERYGAHLSKEEVESVIAPHPESLDRVDRWLQLYGIQASDIVRSPAKDWITVKVPVSLAEIMLNTVSHRTITIFSSVFTVDDLDCRHTAFGNIPRVVIPSSAPRVIVFLQNFTSTSMSYSLPRCLHASRN